MRTRALRASALVLLLAAAGAALAAQKGAPAPPSFRAWKHVGSKVVADREHDMYGFHQGYANEAALRGLRSKATPPSYEQGATFVVSIYEVEARGGATVPGAKRRDVVQVKDRTATATGGWRFAAFDPQGRPVAVDQAACFSCHAAAPERDFVLTTYQE